MNTYHSSLHSNVNINDVIMTIFCYAVPQAPKAVPKVPKPFGKHPDACRFGIDYSNVQPSSQATWTPQPPQQSQQSRPLSQEVVQCEPTGYTVNYERPAWRETLRTTGVRPWDMDLDFVYKQPEVRSEPYNPVPTSPPPGLLAPPSSEPFEPAVTPSLDATADDEEGPRVLHLQYNSPMKLYSDSNVKEVMAGQTKQNP